MKKHRIVLCLLCSICFLPTALAQDKARKMKIEDLYKFKRVSDPQISPDGKWIAYNVSEVSLKKNNSTSDIWLAPTNGGAPKRLTNDPKSNSNPRWSPDGKQLLFISGRSGSDQVWIIDAKGGKPRQVTDIATGAEEPQWSPDGKNIAFVSSVWPEFAKKSFKVADKLNKKRMDEMEKNPVKARVYDRLFFRHWNHYLHGKRRHVFVVSASGGDPKNVTPYNRDADPVSFTFSAGDDFTFTPDGKYLLLTVSPEKGEAWKTNSDICKIPITGGKLDCLTKDNPAADSMPRFSPDGKWLAWRAQKKPGYEADRWQLYITPADGKGAKRSLTAKFNASVDEFAWAPDGRTIYFLAGKDAAVPLWSVAVDTGKVTKRIDKHNNIHFSLANDGKTMAVARMAQHHPTEVFVHNLETGSDVNVSKANEKLLSQLDLPRPESVTVKGAGGTPMQMWILKPPGFDASKKWPLVYLVHGGPQGAWSDFWSYRWNPQIWAAQGYVIAMPNPRGSTGFGQKYTEEISRDWGGKVFVDLMKGMDYMEKLPYIDKKRCGSAGASYGGYMMNWFQGNTDRFKTLICHCGVYNLESMYGVTEELWFVEWDIGGKPWDNFEAFRKFSPHRYAKNFKTPMLILHGERDFRVPIGEGMQMFTTLQRLGVPSKMVVFPDEGHWISKPRNGQFWHRQVFSWLKKYVPPGGR